MKIQFLGTGGGRVNTMLQLRATGGIYIEIDDARIFLDPGPGALVKANEQKINLAKLDAVLVSHCHVDHSNDAAVMVEAMTEGNRAKRGTLAASVSTLEGHPKTSEQVITSYHQRAVENLITASPGKKFMVKGVEIISTPADHTDPTTIGFKLIGEKTVSYTSDTIFTEDVANAHEGADILILNALYTNSDQKVRGSLKHMDTDGARKFIERIRPELAIIQHFGMGAIRKGPWNIAKELEEKTGIKVVAAKDNQVFEFGKEKSLADWNS